MGLFFIPFGLFVIIGSSNAVNLTDGLDGLATVPVMLVALSFTLISYVVGNTIFSEYLQIQYIPDVGELSIFCGSIVGSCLGFLWYNAPPAKIFMGDTGSLSLGGSLAAIAIITKHEIVLAIIGGLFVLETVSVIIQVASFKLTGKRFLKWHRYTTILKKRVGRVNDCNSFLDNCYNFSISRISNFKIKVKYAHVTKTQRTIVPCLWFRNIGTISCKIFKKNKFNDFKVWDDNQKKLFKKYQTLNLKKTLAKVDYIILSPGISLLKNEKLNKYKKKIITDIDLLYLSKNNFKSIVVTGTNGKSTTCKLLAHLLKKIKLSTL